MIAAPKWRRSMQDSARKQIEIQGMVYALGENPIFGVGDHIRISTRSPIGHYRVPTYLRGKAGSIEAVIEPAAIDYEVEGYGRNAGDKRHYYRIAIPMRVIWPNYIGSPKDGLRIEIFETWLERI
jgi:nitrile hydratase subunit beta